MKQVVLFIVLFLSSLYLFSQDDETPVCGLKS